MDFIVGLFAVVSDAADSFKACDYFSISLNGSVSPGIARSGFGGINPVVILEK